ncbi:Tyrosine-protein phosphatase non-receptor type 23 [Homalodisca vitripennis]|nr:Tyrosine-protein phosphatase non-receptor type 23 [Homalodisca vitripennis]
MSNISDIERYITSNNIANVGVKQALIVCNKVTRTIAPWKTQLIDEKVIEEALTFTMDVVEGKRKAAKNENEFIYHEEVPDKDALPEIKGAALVKGIPFVVTDPDIAGPDIFGRLVPMKAHEASSLYSEEKAKLLRKMGALMDEKDQELVAFMSSLHLDCVNAHLEPDRLPQDIVDRCAALSAKPDAIQNLIESMDKLSDIYHDVEAMLKEIMELIHRSPNILFEGQTERLWEAGGSRLSEQEGYGILSLCEYIMSQAALHMLDGVLVEGRWKKYVKIIIEGLKKSIKGVPRALV